MSCFEGGTSDCPIPKFTPKNRVDGVFFRQKEDKLDDLPKRNIQHGQPNGLAAFHFCFKMDEKNMPAQNALNAEWFFSFVCPAKNHMNK